MTTSLENQEHPVPAQNATDDQGWRLGRWFLLAGLVGVAAGAIFFGGRTVTLHDDVSTANGAAASASAEATVQARTKDEIADRALALCADASPDQLAKLNGIGLCKKAAEAKELPSPSTVTPEVPFSLVKTAVDAYFAANPPVAGPPPADDVVLKFVRQVYDANRPADGKPPTDAELLALIRQVYAANPPQNGADGRNAHCYDVPADPACQPRNGAQGISVTDIQLDSSGGGCELVVLLHDPATGSDSSTRKPVNPTLCGPTTPPSTTTATATVTENPPLPLPTS